MAIDTQTKNKRLRHIAIAALSIACIFLAGSAIRFQSTSVLYVTDFGAVGDGVTDDTAAIQAAIDFQSGAGGVVMFPATDAYYVIGSTIILAPNVTLRGVSRFKPMVVFTGGESACFQFVGTSESQNLSCEIENLFIESGTFCTGTAIRCRNFSGIGLHNVRIKNFHYGVWLDWGIGVVMDGCLVTKSIRGLQLGGGTGGIRGGVFSGSPFMDSVTVRNCAFAENEIDINDMGSENSLGGFILSGTSFFHQNSVGTHTTSVRISGRDGFKSFGNWVEEFNAGCVGFMFNYYDYDGTIRGIPTGCSSTSDKLRMQGGEGTTGIRVDRSNSLHIGQDIFEWGNAVGGYGIDLEDVTSPVDLAPCTFKTYSGGGYTETIHSL